MVFHSLLLVLLLSHIIMVLLCCQCIPCWDELRLLCVFGMMWKYQWLGTFNLKINTQESAHWSQISGSAQWQPFRGWWKTFLWEAKSHWLKMNRPPLISQWTIKRKYNIYSCCMGRFLPCLLVRLSKRYKLNDFLKAYKWRTLTGSGRSTCYCYTYT